MLALGDALAMSVSRARNFSADDFRKRHPGGMLGRQMMYITDVLRFRAGDNLPLIRDTATVGHMLQQLDSYTRPPGATLIIDDAGRLVGIVTDADLRRRYRADGELLARPVASIMTASPKVLLDTALVRDAVQLVRELRVDEIPIVDAAGKPVGLLDVQDLIALKVIEE
jgi:arabinose-5-phosphate isomerase